MQKEEVLDCVDIIESQFIYQMNNARYKSCTLKSVQKSYESDSQKRQCSDESLKNVEPCSRIFRCVYS